MKTPTRYFCPCLALFALGGALTLSLAPVFAAGPVDSPAMQPLADTATPPLKATFDKAKSDEGEGPYRLRLRNTSTKGLMVAATIVSSVPVHNNEKVREEPARHVGAGKSLTIHHLSAGDKVTVKVEGYVPLELTVP